MKKVFYILTILLFSACGESTTSHNDIYTIIKEEPNEAFSKDNLEIELIKKVDKETLNEIAITLRDSRKKYDKLWIFYYIKGVEHNIAWATTHFTPNLEVNIIGSTNEQDSVTSTTTDIKGEILGKWRSEVSLSGASLVLYKNDNDELMMKITFKDGTSMVDNIKEKITGNKIRYNDNNSHGEYYILESNGNLGMYGNDGKFDEAIKFD